MSGCKRAFMVGLLRRSTHDDDNFAFDIDVSEILVSSVFGVDRVPALAEECARYRDDGFHATKIKIGYPCNAINKQKSDSELEVLYFAHWSYSPNTT